jgi:hypothetical protein
MRRESGGGTREPADIVRCNGPMRRAAERASGPGRVEDGRPGSPQGAWPRQGPEPSLVAACEGRGGVAGAGGRLAEGARPQQQDSPRQRVAHLQCRACDSASKCRVTVVSPRANSPRPPSASVNASSRLLRSVRAGRGCCGMPGSLAVVFRGGGSVREGSDPPHGRDRPGRCQGGPGSREIRESAGPGRTALSPGSGRRVI